MSNSLAIAAVTLTLRNLLFHGVNADLAGTHVTTRPPDKARDNFTGNQVNLFLYHTVIEAAWRNMDMPGQSKPGESGQPPLPLNLYYLITTYGDNDDDALSHRLLGRAMSVLHDHPLLAPDDIRQALANNDLYVQVERVRVTPQPISLEEMSRLWTTFQTQYRISAGYEASVVLIESTLPSRAPLPVLRRGPDDSGAAAQGSTDLPFPSLDGLTLPGGQLSAHLGDPITLIGQHLAGDAVALRLSHRLLPDPLPVPPPPLLAAGDTEIQATLPNDPAILPPGMYGVTAVISRAGQPDSITNAVPLPVAASIVEPPLPHQLALDPTGRADWTVRCSPRVLGVQQAYLILGDHQFPADPRTAPDPNQPAPPTDTLTFHIHDLAPGEYTVRLRVDGVDSVVIDRSVTPPRFDPNQKVIVQ